MSERIARALLTAYRRHVDEINPAIDHPTRRMLQHILLDEEEQAQWGDAAVAAVMAEDADAAAAWRARRSGLVCCGRCHPRAVSPGW